MKNTWKIYGISLALSGAFLSCQQTEEAFQDRKTRENKAEIRQYMSNKGIKADSTKSGLFYSVQNIKPNGAKPQIGDEITIRYVAQRLDGVVIDSTLKASPFVYIRVPGTSTAGYFFESVPSLEELMTTGVEKVREGDRISLFVPWLLRSTRVAVSLLAPLYIPLRYDLEILKVRSEARQIQDYLVSKKLPKMEINGDSLRFVKTLSRPDSAQVKIGDEVIVKYTGRLVSNDKVFDPITGTTPSSITMTVVDPATSNRGGGVVKGFNDGVAKLRFGEKAIVIFPSILGYGTNPKGSIPSYSPLYFELELVRK